jgi:GT2 family glycosyltransferase
MTPVQVQVTVVTVSFNSEAVLPSMLSSIPPGTPVVIVDNASRDQARLHQLADQHSARLVALDRNLGFGVACNAGADLAATEFLLFLNPDAILRPGAIGALLDAARRHPEASAFNPRITHEDGSLHFKRRSNLLPRGEWLSRKGLAQEGELPVLVGSAIFVSKRNFDQVGGFDPNIFLYYEDDDLSLRLRREVGPLFYVPQAEVMHAGGVSSSRSVEVARIKGHHLGRSRIYACVKHGVRWGRSKALVDAVLGAMSPLVVFSARKRTKEWARLSATFRSIIGTQS